MEVGKLRNLIRRYITKPLRTAVSCVWSPLVRIDSSTAPNPESDGTDLAGSLLDTLRRRRVRLRPARPANSRRGLDPPWRVAVRSRHPRSLPVARTGSARGETGQRLPDPAPRPTANRPNADRRRATTDTALRATPTTSCRVARLSWRRKRIRDVTDVTGATRTVTANGRKAPALATNRWSRCKRRYWKAELKAPPVRGRSATPIGSSHARFARVPLRIGVAETTKRCATGRPLSVHPDLQHRRARPSGWFPRAHAIRLRPFPPANRLSRSVAFGRL